MAARIARHPRHLALLALVVGLLLGGVPDAAAPAAVFSALVVAVVTRRPGTALLVAALVLAGSWTGARRLEAIDRSPLHHLVGRTVGLRGYVIRRERPTASARRVRLRVAAARLLAPGSPWKRLDDTVQVRIPLDRSVPDMEVGDEAIAEGALERPSNRPGADFDYAGYLRRAGVHGLLRASLLTSTGRRRGGLAQPVDTIRRRADEGVGAGLDPVPAALARGMVLGEDESVPADVTDQFKASGLAHLLAVSGQNVTLLALLALPLLALVGLGRRGRLFGVLALIALYVPLTGASASILRAGAMGAAGTIAAIAGRPGSRWYALLLSAAFTLALDPRAWLDAGWQLSFAAVVGIFCLVPALMGALSRLPDAVAAGTAVSIAATVATAPLMAFHFGRLSLVSLPANLLALPAVAPIMWLGMLSAAAAQVSVEAAALLNAVNGFCLAYLAEVARWTSGWPDAALPARIGSPAALAGTYVALAAALVAAGRWRAWRSVARSRPSMRRRALAIALCGLVAVTAATSPSLLGGHEPRRPKLFTISFLDVGQGDAILLQPPGRAVLVDGGPPEADVAGLLRRHGVGFLDVAVLTHPQRDHQGGLETVLRKLPVGLLLDGGSASRDPTHRRIATLARNAGTRVVTAAAGQFLRVGGLKLTVLSPREAFDPGAGEPNVQAVVLLASYRGLDALLPADAESDITLGIAKRTVEVLKVAHHGSEDERLGALLHRLRPQVAVIEVGAHNPYGHPRPETLARLRAAHTILRRTDLNGEVRVSLGPDGPIVESDREPDR